MRKFSKFLFSGLILCSVGLSGSEAYGQQKKPNIIFILVDDQGYGDIGAFFQNSRAKLKDPGKPFEISPHLDALAASGAMLMQDYSSAPVCAPSRASLMLGVSQGHANVRNNQFDKALADNYTMPSTLQRLGYATIAIGKWGLQGDADFDKDGASWPARPTNRGFDHFFGYMRHIDGHEHYPKEALYYNKKHVEVWQDGKDITPGLDKCYTADLWTAYAKHWITAYVNKEKNTNKEDQPFFMYLAYETPHAVLELPTQAYPKGGGLKGGLRWTGEKGRMINTASGKIDSWINPEYRTATYDDDHDPATPELPWPDTYKRYAMANRRIDDGVGDLVQLLKDLHIDDNTIIVYTSDNGPSIESYLPKSYEANHPTFFRSYGPFDGIKRDTWEGGMRMPTIAVWPGHIPAGRKITAPTISYDWAATFTSIAGKPAPARMDGVSLLSVLTGKGKKENSLSKPLYTEYYVGGKTPGFKDFAPDHRNRTRNQMQWIRVGDYVGVRYDIISAKDDFEIYNVVRDPGQRTNLQSSNKKVRILLDGQKRKLSIPELQQLMKDRVLQMRVENTTAPRPYDTVSIPGVAIKGKQHSGINWAWYPGDFPWLPQVEGMKPAMAGHLDEISIPNQLGLISSEDSKNSGVLYFEGAIKVATSGEYTFKLQSSGSALLKLHDAVLIDADFKHESGKTYSKSVRLKAGLHPLRVYFAYTGEKPSLHLSFDGVADVELTRQ
ncbi:MAG TPA: sulfatase-like hydrolase/transferase [Arachidicoccus sp.]|nr:sulfatase-like hydrolase/transferase [Arachidicoccus sp.]